MAREITTAGTASIKGSAKLALVRADGPRVSTRFIKNGTRVEAPKRAERVWLVAIKPSEGSADVTLRYAR